MTPFQGIYDAFLSRISDYSFLNLDSTQLETILNKYLLSAIPDIKKFIKVDLSDRTSTQFNQTVDDVSIKILACQMVVEWLSPQINSTLLTRQVLNDRDFKMYSQANHLDELIRLKKDALDDIDKLIINLSYDSIRLEALNNNDAN